MRLLALCTLLLTGGCAVQIGFTDPYQRSAALAAFRTGQSRLSCTTPNCLVVWSATRPSARRLAETRNWEELATYVLAADFDQDLAWYYLGVAASGLGYRDAARLYLDRSIQDTLSGGIQACTGSLCDGVSLPFASRIAIANIPPPPRAAVRAAARRPRSVGPATPATAWVDPPAADRPAETAAPDAGGTAWVKPVPTQP